MALKVLNTTDRHRIILSDIRTFHAAEQIDGITEKKEACDKPKCHISQHSPQFHFHKIQSVSV